ncbi:MAG: hypothetical protein LUD48_05520, partial [Prevotella sp.]|nr:hypothetical protein [Prevotella sp.]
SSIDIRNEGWEPAMKIILSRKGFDSANGGIPSPILPDGTLLSLPIPETNENIHTKYTDLFINGVSYSEIIRQLLPARSAAGGILKSEKTYISLDNARCHMDPDLAYRYKPDASEHAGCAGYVWYADWHPAYGQQGTALKHLIDHNVGPGDIFLFYCWFRRTYIKQGEVRKIQFVPGRADETKDRHVIFGYMEVKEVITGNEAILSYPQYRHHPHAQKGYTDLNALFIPRDKLSFCSQSDSPGTIAGSHVPGYGLLEKYAPARQLTMEGHHMSEWALPDWMRDAKISYHNNITYGWLKGKDCFISARRGQEFVVECDNTKVMQEWVLHLIRGK